MTTTLVIIILSLICSAFFSGMEIAYVSANKIHIEIEKKQEGWISTILGRMTKTPSKFITTMLLGNNIALVIYGFYMGDFLVTQLAPHHPLSSAFLTYWLTGNGLIVTKTVISTLVILITAEFLPKVFFQIYANSMLKIFAVPTYLCYLLFNFLSSFVMWISDSILKLFFKTEGDEVQEAFSKVELGNYISEQMETVDNEKEIDSEIFIFKNALEFPEIKAREVMIPRTEIVTIALSESLQTLREKFIETGLSKILIYKESHDDIVGYTHSFELFKKPKSIQSILLPVLQVPETMLAKEVLNALLKKRKSIAVVLDEYGGTSGIITIEDIVEELFGEIEDEHDSPLLIEEQISDYSYRFSARAEIDYINEAYNLDLPKSENYETLSGLILHYTEDIPKKGGTIIIENFRFNILDVSETKIDLVQLDLLKKDQN